MAKAAKMRVIIPRNPEDLLKLAKKVYEKHVVDGGGSPLNNMVDQDWDADGPQIDQAILLHHQAEDYKLKMEEMYRQRDLLLSKIKETLLASREILSGVHRSNMKRMGEWGFSIDDSPKASVSKKSV